MNAVNYSDVNNWIKCIKNKTRSDKNYFMKRPVVIKSILGSKPSIYSLSKMVIKYNYFSSVYNNNDFTLRYTEHMYVYLCDSYSLYMSYKNLLEDISKNPIRIYFKNNVLEQIISVVWHPDRFHIWKYYDEEYNIYL